MEEKTKRSASLTFRGFLKSPEEVDSLVGVKAELLAQSGQPKKPNRPNVRPRSVAMFQVEFEDNAQIVDIIPAILAHVGGLDRVRAALEQISPEFLEVNLVLPIRYSKAQEQPYPA